MNSSQFTLLFIAGLPISGTTIAIAGVILAVVIAIAGFFIYRSGKNKDTKSTTSTGAGEWQRQAQGTQSAAGRTPTQGAGNNATPWAQQGQQAGGWGSQNAAQQQPSQPTWNAPGASSPQAANPWSTQIASSPQQGANSWSNPGNQGFAAPAQPAWNTQNASSPQASNPWETAKPSTQDWSTQAATPGSWNAQGAQGTQGAAAQQPSANPWNTQLSSSQQQPANSWNAPTPSSQQQPPTVNPWNTQQANQGGAGAKGSRSPWDAPDAQDPWNQPQSAPAQSTPWGQSAASPQQAPTAFGGNSSAPSWNPSTSGSGQNGQGAAQGDSWAVQPVNNAAQAPAWQQGPTGFGSDSTERQDELPTAFPESDKTMLRTTGPQSGLGIVRVEEGKEPGRVYEIRKDSLSIGRSRESDIFLEDLAVSRLHASVVSLGNGNYALKDEGSANGTKVNGQLVNKYQTYPLQEGDRIQLGQTVLVFAKH